MAEQPSRKRRNIRRGSIVVLAAVGALAVLWQAGSTGDPRLIGTWALYGDATAGYRRVKPELELGGWGSGSCRARPLRWRTKSDKLYIDVIAPGENQLTWMLRRFFENTRNELYWEIVEIRPDVVLLKTSDGDDCRLKRQRKLTPLPNSGLN